MNLLIYFLFGASYWVWTIFFFLFFQKTLFVALNNSKFGRRPSSSEIMNVYSRGGISDAIVASYITVVPLLLALVHAIIPGFSFQWTMFGYSCLISLAIALVSLGDAILYGYWNAKIDSSVFMYLHQPKQIASSVCTTYLLIAICSVILVAALFWLGSEFITGFTLSLWNYSESRLYDYIGVPLLFILMGGILFMIIRGLKIRPNNPSVVYFSPEPILNHWALNPAYSLIYSLGTRNEFEGKFREFDDEECKKIIEPLYPKEGLPAVELLNTDRPDILVIVWESFSSEFCGALGGKDVTPGFSELCKEGILFSSCRASSFRTDRAFPAIFCGLPGQPTTSIVRHTRKLPKLPAFPRQLRELGYETSAVYGGDLTIMHQSDFFLSSGHTHIFAQKDIPLKTPTGKWGFHDGDVADWLFGYLQQQSEKGKPWLTTWQTLSSHEPFIVPYASLPDKEDNSMAYTDDAIGRLLEKLKNSPLWKNLLVVIVADHGLNRSHYVADRESYSHIPLLWTGGAIRQPSVIDTVMCQTDIAATLLAQMKLPHDSYPFSRDIFSPSYKNHNTLHTWANGFLFADETGYTEYDNVAQQAAGDTGDAQREKKAKAILQALYEYIDKL